MTLVKNKETYVKKKVSNLIPPSNILFSLQILVVTLPTHSRTFPFLPLKNLNAD